MTGQNLRSSLLGKIAAYTEILAKDPQSTIFVSLGEAYRKIGMLDDARKVIEQGLKLHPDSSPGQVVHARILCQQGDYQASATAFESSLSLDSESLAALVGYARLNILMGDESKAREMLLTARELSPADPVINKLLLSLPAEIVEVEGKTGEGDEAVEPAQPSLTSATLAELYLKQGLEQQALDIYRELALKDPNNLVLRRQIRDLEERQSGLPAGENDEQQVSVQDVEITSDVIETQNIEGFKDAADTPEEPVTFAPKTADLADNKKVLDRLNRWLDSIQQRRSDV